MKRIWLILILTIVMLLSACEVSDKTVGLDPSGYHSGTDMQFFQISESAKLPHIQEYNNGCYVYHNGFIYSYDRTNNIIQPLCSKVNCLHDKEQDNERKKACHAYITDTDPQEVSIMMYKDQLYICIDQIISEESFSLDGATIFRIAADGSAREIFYEIDNAEVSFPMLHRGFIYYMRQSFKLSDDSVSSKLTYQRINVDEKDPKPETFHEIPDERQFQGFNTILAYGKYVYFNYSYLDAEGYHNPLFVYDKWERREDDNTDEEETANNIQEADPESSIIEEVHQVILDYYAAYIDIYRGADIHIIEDYLDMDRIQSQNIVSALEMEAFSREYISNEYGIEPDIEDSYPYTIHFLDTSFDGDDTCTIRLSIDMEATDYPPAFSASEQEYHLEKENDSWKITHHTWDGMELFEVSDTELYHWDKEARINVLRSIYGTGK